MGAGKFTKAEIIDIIYQKSDMSRADIKMALDTAFDSIKEALIGCRTVELRGFGTFEVRFRKGRSKARNPRTGEIVPVLPHGTAVFRPGKEIKQGVWTNAKPPENETPSDEKSR
ncbi:MAG: integration host factor subunit beta [Spirochaetaceae bacterium]|jgi:integration host factor subunit beta|nr:integration host factor subunit beta [Spirochaetaceae bacterium]